jgi:hypothetical protein
MHARVTPFKMKVGARNAAVARMGELKDAIMAMPGMLHFINVMNDDGTGYVVALVDSKETSDANQERTMEMWGRFSDLLEATPDPAGFDVMANWPK